MLLKPRDECLFSLAMSSQPLELSERKLASCTKQQPKQRLPISCCAVKGESWDRHELTHLHLGFEDEARWQGMPVFALLAVWTLPKPMANSKLAQKWQDCDMQLRMSISMTINDTARRNIHMSTTQPGRPLQGWKLHAELVLHTKAAYQHAARLLSPKS